MESGSSSSSSLMENLEQPHVLAVDDNLVDRKLIERLLKNSSCKGNKILWLCICINVSIFVTLKFCHLFCVRDIGHCKNYKVMRNIFHLYLGHKIVEAICLFVLFFVFGKIPNTKRLLYFLKYVICTYMHVLMKFL